MTSKPICLVIGAGGGIGANVAKKFALEGYHACSVSYTHLPLPTILLV